MNRALQAAVDRIGLALRSRTSPSQPAPVVLSDEAVRQVAADADLVDLFTCNARAAGAQVDVVSSDNLSAWLRWVIERLAGQRVLIDPSLPAARPIAEDLGERATLMSADAGDAYLFSADMAVVSAQAAVAETGSVVCTSGSGRWRGVSLVPPVLVAVVSAERIVPDLCDLFADWQTRDAALSGASNVSIITGPSRTADIEGVPVVGVHGPARVWIVIVPERSS